jgi:4-hydroxybenzoate polyprenyltransferase
MSSAKIGRQVSSPIWMLLYRGTRKRAWIKNLLIFFPLLFDFEKFELCRNSFFFLFASFSAMASAVYIFNDCMDRKRDRLHPIKKERIQSLQDFATRHIAASILICLMISACFSVPIFQYKLLMSFLTYLLLNIIYSLWLKKIKWIDIACLSVFLMIRVGCGYTLMGRQPSPALLGVVWFIFLISAFGKRLIEIQASLVRGAEISHLGRPYGPSTWLYRAAFWLAVRPVGVKASVDEPSLG